MGGIDQSIGPGLGGFLVFFLLAMALWLLMRNMGKHLRNVAYMREREEKEGAAARQGHAQGGDRGEGGDGTDDRADEVQTRPRSLAAGIPTAPLPGPQGSQNSRDPGVGDRA